MWHNKRFELPHYYAVLQGLEKPYYLLQKEVKAEVNFNDRFLSTAVSDLEQLSLSLVQKKEFEAFGSQSILWQKVQLLKKILEVCEFCERRCRVNRYEKISSCGVPLKPKIASIFLHPGEEEELIPSLTIFYAGCNFRCLFCQNYDIARFPLEGEYFEPEKLATTIKSLEKRARNVNFVGGDPTPAAHHVFETLLEGDFELPVIWNSNMYQSKELQSLLIGVVDLYLADFKYGNDSCALKLSGIRNYMEIVTRNLLVARETSDVIIRHLVLPGHLDCCTAAVLDWLKNNYPEANLNVMFQYRPCADACTLPGLDRPLNFNEKEKVIRMVMQSGLKNARVG